MSMMHGEMVKSCNLYKWPEIKGAARPRWRCRCWLSHHTQSKKHFFSFQINNEKRYDAEGYLWKWNESKQNVSDWHSRNPNTGMRARIMNVGNCWSRCLVDFHKHREQKPSIINKSVYLDMCHAIWTDFHLSQTKCQILSNLTELLSSCCVRGLQIVTIQPKFIQLI